MVLILYRIMSSLALNKLKKKTPVEKVDRPRKKIDRFDGLTEEEVQKYTLPDYLEMNLDIVFVGINPSLMSAHRGRYYASPGNHFYKLLHESGLTSRRLCYEEDYKLPQYGIGLTNIVTRATKSSADLKYAEIKEGSKIIEEKLKIYKPKIAVFNGKCIYDVFAHKTGNFNFGLQPEHVGETAIWVTPSSSARCANFPKMTDKLHFFTSLKKYLQFLKGDIKDIDMKELLFEGKCKQFIPRTSKMWRRKNVSAFSHGGRVANKDTMYLNTSDEYVTTVHSTEFIVKKLQDKNGKTKEICDINESESLKNSETCISQDVSLQEKHSQLVGSIKSNTNITNTNNLEKCLKSDAVIPKIQTDN
ncbi:PREDICTED: G/T mismatch-specific thymine DNA glycosylase-like [Habropoda laboriosa]|uniref:G/T mismatch-specific thymine DNA glycosylase-like n=1 Tax=Habropoda laboriosa TaxID=597456 RepID=UPI00083E355A|nr:PREDICTED: G/T mismatch-specific thymine DNA glycosylase-like [Habropoda laboriosa]